MEMIDKNARNDNVQSGTQYHRIMPITVDTILLLTVLRQQKCTGLKSTTQFNSLTE